MARPDDLNWPCTVCPKWREKEYKIHDVAAEVKWRGFQDNIKACEFDPRYAAPDKANQCPYIRYFGKQVTMVAVQCDFCHGEISRFIVEEGKTMEECAPPPDIEEGNNNEGMHICDKCLNKPKNKAVKEIVLKNRKRRGRG